MGFLEAVMKGMAAAGWLLGFAVVLAGAAILLVSAGALFAWLTEVGKEDEDAEADEGRDAAGERAAHRPGVPGGR